ncbi:hypothetical protein GLYMA_17G129900v4 [Glycine max]|uniref:Uncharacterized protein n=1 Tax=Glycine max TaxID=3847 RepID=A0A0R0FLM6_SOYBN|nr:hypothetical protein GYH30_047135 [Glycine max]KRH03961.1 hypothetical protein GLYMA_17G129900v4 [Glycine max]
MCVHEYEYTCKYIHSVTYPSSPFSPENKPTLPLLSNLVPPPSIGPSTATTTSSTEIIHHCVIRQSKHCDSALIRHAGSGILRKKTMVEYHLIFRVWMTY